MSKETLSKDTDSELSLIISPTQPSNPNINSNNPDKKDIDRLSDLSDSTLLDDTQVEKEMKTSEYLSDDDSIDTWAKDIVKYDLPIMYHLIDELKRTRERLEKLTRSRPKKKRRIVVNE